VFDDNRYYFDDPNVDENSENVRKVTDTANEKGDKKNLREIINMEKQKSEDRRRKELSDKIESDYGKEMIKDDDPMYEIKNPWKHPNQDHQDNSRGKRNYKARNENRGRGRGRGDRQQQNSNHRDGDDYSQ
jgi:hypothetical protein